MGELVSKSLRECVNEGEASFYRNYVPNYSKERMHVELPGAVRTCRGLTQGRDGPETRKAQTGIAFASWFNLTIFLFQVKSYLTLKKTCMKNSCTNLLFAWLYNWFLSF